MTSDKEPQDNITTHADETLVSRSKHGAKPDDEPPAMSVGGEKTAVDQDKKQPLVVDSKGSNVVNDTATAASVPPWTLQQFFNGEIDLDVELVKRFPNMPLMSTIRFRSLGIRTGRGVATLATVDGAASVIFDADMTSRVVQISFTYGSMLTLKFTLDQLGDTDRTRWLELMRREQGGLAFLWGPARWERDYVICISRKYSTNFYAFSPSNFEASIRMTPDVVKKLLNWLEEFWTPPPPGDEEPPKLLTW